MMKCERGLQQIDQQRPRTMKQFANGSPAKPPILSATVKTALFAFVLFPTLSIADDWPHWLGPTRDFVWAENGIIQEMPESELKVLWRAPIGAGYSVANGKVYSTDYVKTSGEITNRASWKDPLAGYERIRCYDSETGELLWQHEAINGLNPETGSVYWSHPINATLRMSIIVPRKQGNLLYASTQKGVGIMLELDDERPTGKALWRNRPGIAASSLANTPVFMRETIYGCDVQTSSLIAFNPRNGERFWQTKKPTFGERKGRHAICFVVRHKQSDRYFILSKTGDLILAKLTPEAYEELWCLTAVEPTNTAMGRNFVWSHPAFAQKRMFARNDKELI